MRRGNRGGWELGGRDRPHERLDVWRHGVELALCVYEVTGDFPDEERYGLVAQLRRSAVSIPSNIAEGAGRGTDADFLRFLYMARGSLNEVDTQLQISDKLGILTPSHFERLREPFTSVSNTLDGLIRSLDS